MNDMKHSAFAAFLIEDVILTLANLRASLCWLSETAEGHDSGPDHALRRRAGLDRIDRQIGMLEDRARALCRGLQRAGNGGDVFGSLPVTEPVDAGQDSVAAWRRDGARDQADDREPAGAAPAHPAFAPPSIAEAIRDALAGDGQDDGDAKGRASERDLAAGDPEVAAAGANAAPDDVTDGAVGNGGEVAAPIFRSRRAS